MPKGQSSIEFMQAAAISLLFFTVALAIYFAGQESLSEMSEAAEARRICYEVASQISTVASAGEGASALLIALRKATYGEYEIFVTGGTGTVSVNYKGADNESRGASCFVGQTNIVNASGASDFKMNGDETVYYSGGVLRVG